MKKLFLALLLFFGMTVSSLACDKLSLISQMRSAYPYGYSVYLKMKNNGTENEFLQFVDCELPSVSLATAIHESIHHLSIDNNVYITIENGRLKRLVRPTWKAPKEMSKMFSSDEYVDNYIVGGASSSQEIEYLIEEFNAYIHDSRSGRLLFDLDKGAISSPYNDGVLAMMAFIKKYSTIEPRFLKDETTKVIVRHLWSLAEKEVNKSCSIKTSISETGHKYIRILKQKNESFDRFIGKETKIC